MTWRSQVTRGRDSNGIIRVLVVAPVWRRRRRITGFAGQLARFPWADPPAGCRCGWLTARPLQTPFPFQNYWPGRGRMAHWRTWTAASIEFGSPANEKWIQFQFPQLNVKDSKEGLHWFLLQQKVADSRGWDLNPGRKKKESAKRDDWHWARRSRWWPSPERDPLIPPPAEGKRPHQLFSTTRQLSKKSGREGEESGKIHWVKLRETQKSS